MVFDKLGNRDDELVGVGELAKRIDSQCGFRRCMWRRGTKQDLSARLALRRVVPAYYGGHGIEKRERVWLLVEWRDGEDEPAHYFFCSIPGPLTKKKLVQIAMQRSRTERAYQDLKGELGLYHNEGRRFPGWHHHVSVVLCCYAFIVAERARHSPPLGHLDDGKRRAVHRGLSGTFTTASSSCVSRSRALSRGGCHAAPCAVSVGNTAATQT